VGLGGWNCHQERKQAPVNGYTLRLPAEEGNWLWLAGTNECTHHQPTHPPPPPPSPIRRKIR